ncbi:MULTISPECIES: DAPG hydrolase family protein [unclassified Nocardia]|uniref:DAPG hydrolase family protein n=1 Tax=unclassified Nocardia TaxID=2637762 RepID=UPI0033AF2E07
MVRQPNISRRGALAIGVGAAGTLMSTAMGVARAEDPADNQRYAGYTPRDWAEPYARYMTGRTAPAPMVVVDAYTGPPSPAERIPLFADLPADLAPSGTSPVETGYGFTGDGAVWVAVRTEMPRVSAAMWDWWFGWHLAESARYKLWHPDAHRYAEVAADRSGVAGPDRDRYVGNISYVDEYIGATLQQLAIAFRDPREHGFTVPDGHTIVFGRVGSSVFPVDLGWLAHQVRPIEGGCEMRSRFYLNLVAPRPPDPHHIARAVQRGAAVDVGDLVPDLAMARDLLMCGQEMNHLARFLPELHAEFGR